MRPKSFILTTWLVLAIQFVTSQPAKAGVLSEFFHLLFSAGRREIPRPPATAVERSIPPRHAPNEIPGMPKAETMKEIPKSEDAEVLHEVGNEAFKKTVEEVIKGHRSNDQRDEQKYK